MTPRTERAGPPPRLPRLMRAALATAANGHRVFPLWPRSKRPAIAGWETYATTNPDDIRRLWDTLPYNVGIACGPSGLHVLDLDDAHGDHPPDEWAGARHGRDVLARLAHDVGEPYPGDTYTVRTPTGGLHLYFRTPENLALRSTVARLGWRIDSRGAGGYIVAAGSVRAEGYYRPMHRAPIAALPPWLATRLAPPPRMTPTTITSHARHTGAYITRIVQAESATVAHARTGTRHRTLLHAAVTLGRLVAGGELAEHDARAALHNAAATHLGHHGWTTAEAERTVTDGLAYGARRPRRLADDDTI
ncbi:bifunctional DNA primase/polymerase [Saccharomonospora saliphila]|uniref:bifunctional DNA primase/polymerase n=1 Tax=Saccharomonospora saliphila TaxID=369829 RepID=UPI001E38913B|nr:bifunctional DNA primase/polymerase [Saccharomonospora saliphila]